MAIEVRVPSAGESISEVFVGAWRKAPNDPVKEGEILVELETDKATLELPAPVSGRLLEVRAAQGESVAVDTVIATIDEGAVDEGAVDEGADVEESAQPSTTTPSTVQPPDAEGSPVMPAARRLLEEHGLRADVVQATGPGGRLLKEDVQRHIDRREHEAQAPQAVAPDVPADAGATKRPEEASAREGTSTPARYVERVPFSPIRTRIAERLVEAQQTAALLTTFNEVDMTQVIALRSELQEAFQKKHGVKLGFMSFFVKAAVRALREFPQVNAEVHRTERGLESIRHHYCDIGIAVGGGKGLVVPVLRNVESMSFAQIERAVAEFAQRAKENTLSLEELQGGTFTISNGGVYGSLLSTPIVNPPQSGILGMHAIEERPIARDGQVVVRKMMYIALTYDHRIVDGREAVTFLVRIKEGIENPARMLLDV